jgi:hypothetical protein
VILPLAIVERSPMEEYTLQHSNIVDALKHNVSDALKLYNELELIYRLGIKTRH